MTAYGGKDIAQKDAIQAEKALAADFITYAACPSYAIQQIAWPLGEAAFLFHRTHAVVLMAEPRPCAMLGPTAIRH